MSIEQEAKEIEAGGKAVQGALDVPIVKNVVYAVLGIGGLIALAIVIGVLW